MMRDEHLRIGMSASWLIAALGQPAAHIHDYSLIQKTGLWDFRHGAYWAEWIDRLQLSPIGLPQPTPTLSDYGTLRISDGSQSAEVPVVAMIGDQQAALFGHGCRLADAAVEESIVMDGAEVLGWKIHRSLLGRGARLNEPAPASFVEVTLGERSEIVGE